MTDSLFHHMHRLRSSGRRFAVATVVRTHGSTPQVAGAKLVLDESGTFVGTLGGGCVEADAIIAAREVMEKGGRSLRAYELTEDLAWNSGLVCGGTMWILAERGDDALTVDGRDVLPELVRAAAGESKPLAIKTTVRRLDGRRSEFASREVVAVDGAPTPRVVRVSEDRDQLVDVISGKPHIVIAGGGHVSLAIYRQAQLLDFDVTILEDRPHFAGKERFPGATVVEADMAASIAATHFGWHSFLVIATRGHKMDGDCCLAAVKTDAKFIGLLGSRRKKALIDRMLREEGVSEARIAAIRSPVGLNIGGRTPAEIALAVMAEITQERYQCERR
ncbi:MAG: XdhC/CoxI family protein [Acidobacteria bacterium]|nr:MAG: XdhC/CoxI family protein [Acidobacteriota bacterium]